MPKKLIIANIVVFILLILCFIGDYLVFGTPINEISLEDWLIFLGISSSIIIISFLLSLIPFRKTNPKKVFGLLTLIFNTSLVGYISFFIINIYIDNDYQPLSEKNCYSWQTLENLESEYIKRALKDIENDEVKEFHLGGFMLLDEEEISFGVKRDSIYKKYGITLQDTGCLYDEIDEKAKEKYYELVKPYLDKRNGKDWQKRLNEELKNIEKSPTE